MSLVGVGTEDGEDGALLPGLGQQLVHKHLPLGELEVGPGLALVGAVPEEDETSGAFLLTPPVWPRHRLPAPSPLITWGRLQSSGMFETGAARLASGCLDRDNKQGGPWVRTQTRVRRTRS